MHLRIKEILKEKKITAISLADNVGMAQPSMSNIVNGKVMPSIDTLQKIADALNVPFTELFERPKQNQITCPKCGTLLELREPVPAESPAMNNNQVKIEVVKQPAESSTNRKPDPSKPASSKLSPLTEQPKQPDPEPNPIPEPPKRTFFPATNYNARPQFRVREGVLIHFGGRQYTRANITDAIALEMLRDAPARIKFFDIYPEDWEELLSL